MGYRGCRGVAALTLVLAAGLMFATGAQAKTHSCGTYVGGADGVTETFTSIKAHGASCTKAHGVLGTFANSAPGGTDLGFTCSRTMTTTNDYIVKCVEGSKTVKAHEKQKL